MFQANLGKALAKTAQAEGIAKTATDFASAIESRIGGGPALAGVHAGILAVVAMAAKNARPVPISPEAAAEAMVKNAALEAELEALRNAPPPAPAPTEPPDPGNT